jgi:Tc5 transposase DNA-binding domain/DDE superfamily endonuclease
MSKCHEGDASRKRLTGAGGKVISEDLDRNLVQWIFMSRRNGLRVGRKMIRLKAEEVFKEVEDSSKATFKASRGWLCRFMTRNGLSVRRRTTAAQKTPDKYVEKMVSFVRFMEKTRVRLSVQPGDIYAMDETAVWFDMLSNTTVDFKGARSVPVKTTGHEKTRCTVILTASGEGKKFKPYVVFFGGARKVKQLYDSKKIVAGTIATSSVNGWMNDELTADYLQKVLGKLAFRKRILVWDAYRCHLSNATKQELKHGYNLTTAVIPGGCTKFLQAPDVCWNKPFKNKLHELYDSWMAGDEDKEYTKTGNMKAPSFELMLRWIKLAWDHIDVDLIKKSFVVCGQTSGRCSL